MLCTNPASSTPSARATTLSDLPSLSSSPRLTLMAHLSTSPSPTLPPPIAQHSDGLRLRAFPFILFFPSRVLTTLPSFVASQPNQGRQAPVPLLPVPGHPRKVSHPLPGHPLDQDDLHRQRQLNPASSPLRHQDLAFARDRHRRRREERRIQVRAEGQGE